MTSTFVNMTSRQTDYLIIGAGAMGMAFADEIFHLQPKSKITIVDRRDEVGGHWLDAYPFVRLHQPAAFYGVNSRKLGNGSTDLSSKVEILDYYRAVREYLEESGRVEFLLNYEYRGEGQVVNLEDPSQGTFFKVQQRLVDATYMNVEVPHTHPPKFQVDDGVPIKPLNVLDKEYDQWDNFCIIGNGKTGIDAVLYLLEKGVAEERIHWVCSHQSWFFNRPSVAVGGVAKEILAHGRELIANSAVDQVFVAMESSSGGMTRLDKSTFPDKWRCATVSPEELDQLRRISNIIEQGRVSRISKKSIVLEGGEVSYAPHTLFVNCTADGLAKRPIVPIFSEGKITLQSLLFCQQVFSAAVIAKLESTNISDKKKNEILPSPHPEYKEDWPGLLSVGVNNLIALHKIFPLWMYQSRLNFMSHAPMIKYFYYSIKAMMLGPKLERAVSRYD